MCLHGNTLARTHGFGLKEETGKPEWAVWWHGNTVVGSRSSFRAEGSKRGRVPAYVFRGGAKGAEGAWRSRVSGNI